MKTLERQHLHPSGILSVNFKADQTLCSGVFIANFEQLCVGFSKI